MSSDESDHFFISVLKAILHTCAFINSPCEVLKFLQVIVMDLWTTSKTKNIWLKPDLENTSVTHSNSCSNTHENNLEMENTSAAFGIEDVSSSSVGKMEYDNVCKDFKDSPFEYYMIPVKHENECNGKLATECVDGQVPNMTDSIPDYLDNSSGKVEADSEIDCNVDIENTTNSRGSVKVEGGMDEDLKYGIAMETNDGNMQDISCAKPSNTSGKLKSEIVASNPGYKQVLRIVGHPDSHSTDTVASGSEVNVNIGPTSLQLFVAPQGKVGLTDSDSTEVVASLSEVNANIGPKPLQQFVIQQGKVGSPDSNSTKTMTSRSEVKANICPTSLRLFALPQDILKQTGTVVNRRNSHVITVPTTGGTSTQRVLDYGRSVISFRCPVCNYGTKDMNCLSKHIRTNHPAGTSCQETELNNSIGDDFIPKHNKLSTNENDTQDVRHTRHSALIENVASKSEVNIDIVPTSSHFCTIPQNTVTQSMNTYSGKRTSEVTVRSVFESVQPPKNSNDCVTPYMYMCSMCTFGTNDVNTLARHIRSHPAYRSHQQVQCDLCKHVYANRSMLRKHKLRVHERKSETSSNPRISVHNFNSDKGECDAPKKEKVCIIKKRIHKIFECDVCGFIAPDRKRLHYHKMGHNPRKTFDCDICGYAAQNQYSLNGHMAKHKNYDTDENTLTTNTKLNHPGQKSGDKDIYTPDKVKKVFLCDVCGYSTKFINQLEDHMNQHTGAKPHKYSLCDYQSACRSSLRLHKQSTHTDEKREKRKEFMCDSCDSKFIAKRTLLIHQMVHGETVIEPLSCNICNYNTFNPKLMQEHHSHEDCENPTQRRDYSLFKCKTCAFSSYKTAILLNHMELYKHEADPSNPKDKSELVNESDGKLESKLWKCSLCEFRASSKRFLWNHRRMMHNTDENKETKKVFLCDVCGYSTKSRNQLQDHMNQHTGAKPHKCSLCDYQSACSSSLRLHRRMMHNTDENKKTKKVFLCDVCSYCTKSRNQLQDHMNQHTGAKPHKCNLCDYQSACSSSLRLHKQSKHADGKCKKRKEYMCDSCDSNFKEKRALLIHQMVHGETVIEPLSCNICNYKTYKARLLKKHKSLHDCENSTQRRDYSLFKCKTCAFSSFKTAILLNHVEKYKHEADPSNPKNMCDLVDVSEEKLESKSMKCSMCEFKTSNKRSLRNHRQRMHKCISGLVKKEVSEEKKSNVEEKKTFLCEYCGHRTHDLISFKNHLRLHTGEMPYKCKECDYRARSIGVVGKHMKRRHSGGKGQKKQIKCEFCDYACGEMRTLLSHQTLRHGKDFKPILRCNVCSYKTVKPYNLKLHMKKHTRERRKPENLSH